MKKLLVTLLFILMIPLGLSITQDTFTNDLISENITFTEGGSIGKTLELPIYIDITTGSIDLKSYAYNGTCYQEFANVSTLCGGLDTGVYYYDTFLNYIFPERAFDGDWSITSASYIIFSAGTQFDINHYINYTIPENTTTLPTWKFKYGYSTLSTASLIDVTENIVVNPLCIDDSRSTINFGIDLYTDLNFENSSISYYCFDITNNKIVIKNINTTPLDAMLLYEEAIIWNKNITVTNLNVTIGDNSNYTSGKFDTLDLSITDYLTALLPECTCTGCSISNNLCSIPFNFYSNTSGILQYSNLDIDYTFNQYDINVTIYDSVTLNVLNGVNITGQYIGSESQEEKTTTNGLFNFKVNITTVSEDVSLILFETEGTDYSLVAKEFTFYQGQSQNISMYMTNTSSTTTNKEVTFIVKDEDKVLLEGAIIKIYKRDPATNQFLELTDLTTNPDGEASTTLTLNDVFYRFIVLYNGRQIYISSAPYPISNSDDTITLNCVVGEAYSDYYIKLQGFDGALEFTKLTNETGYYTITFTSEETVTVCLNTSYTTNTVFVDNGITCLTGTSGVLTSNTISVTKFSDVYGYLSLDFDDAQGTQVIRSLHNYLGLSGSSSDTGRLFIIFGLVILSGVAFVYVPIVGLIVFAIGILIISFTKFTLIDPVYAMFIVGLTIFVIYVLSKNERK